ncbi:MAG: NADH-quinone oxidoreductase subunit L [Deltaproteobacteria bacterium]|jgi:NADH-quinone oxidoreductase subunit L|nr:NADH-quinone oxidoreductase subunit L [Deltaproteobacteria bacterium]
MNYITDDLNLNLVLSIFFLPACTLLILAFFKQYLFRRGDVLATIIMGFCLFFACQLLLNLLDTKSWTLVNQSFNWIKNTNLQGGILVDRLTCIMLVIITLVSFLVHLFSTKYMSGDIRYNRYFCYLLLFTTSMVGLVLANNLLFLFIFWELVGICSYLLIGHWYEKTSAYKAAIKAFIVTKIGDLGMIISLLICWQAVGSLQFVDIFTALQSDVLSGTTRTIFGLGLFFAALGKSAQFPLHVWLPDAMEGPTPVSALIHAATMVAAGVYLLARLFLVFDNETLLYVAYVGVITAIFAACLATVQTDIKRVLAYSTISQLGLMFLGIGVGVYSASIFHLGTHAFFKAGLFLGAGALIYGAQHEQSILKFGGLRRKMPKIAVCYLLCTLALVGFPLFSGFWSKEAILTGVLNFSSNGRLEDNSNFLVLASFATVFLTAFYMFRQFFLTFTGTPRDQEIYENAKDANWQMFVPLVVLSVLALVAGGVIDSSWFRNFYPQISLEQQIQSLTGIALELDNLVYTQGLLQAESSQQLVTVWSIALVFGGIIASSIFFYFNYGSNLNRFSAIFIYFDKLAKTVPNLLASGVNCFAKLITVFDNLILDKIITQGTTSFLNFGGSKLSLIQSGNVRNYFLFSIIGIIVLTILLTN